MHMGLSNDPEEQYRAELMSHFILRKIPNSITEECEEVFHKGRESQKLQQTRKSQQLSAAATSQILQSIQHEGGVLPFSDADTKTTGNTTESNHKAENNKIQHFDEGQAHRGNDNIIEVIDIESSVPFENKPKPGGSTKPTNTIVVASKSAGSTNSANHSSKLPALRDLFCSVEYHRLGEYGLSSSDAAAAYALIVQAGCGSTEELVTFLDEHKQYRPCSCGASEGLGHSQDTGRAVSSTPQHGAHCSSRAASVWVEALTSIKVPAFHAMKIVQALRNDLK